MFKMFHKSFSKIILFTGFILFNFGFYQFYFLERKPKNNQFKAQSSFFLIFIIKNTLILSLNKNTKTLDKQKGFSIFAVRIIKIN